MNYGLGKAISYDETGFLGQSDDAYMRQAWNFMLAGGSAFDSLDYSFTVGREDGMDVEPNGPGGGSPELRRRLKILSGFLKELPLVEMCPDFNVVKRAGGVAAHAMSSSGGEYAIYFDGRGPAEDMVLSLPRGKYESWWVDVRTGAAQDRRRFGHKGGPISVPNPAFEGGISLRIRRLGESR